jgi:methanogenic corrinoid protein MtbC1
MEPILRAIYDDVIAGDQAGVEDGVKRAMADGLPPDRILTDGLISAMDVVGARFERQEFWNDAGGRRF